jgi:hypothetical protein
LLDKEVAEERYEAAESALEILKERAAELEVEVAVLREESGASRLASVRRVHLTPLYCSEDGRRRR